MCLYEGDPSRFSTVLSVFVVVVVSEHETVLPDVEVSFEYELHRHSLRNVTTIQVALYRILIFSSVCPKLDIENSVPCTLEVVSGVSAPTPIRYFFFELHLSRHLLFFFLVLIYLSFLKKTFSK